MEQDALEPLPTTSSILEDVETSNADAVSAATADPDAQADKSSGSSSSAVLDTLLTRLPGAMNRTAIDELATEFCYIQTKNARKRLVATLVGVPRQRLDLLSYYARMVATLGKYFPEIPTAVLEVVSCGYENMCCFGREFPSWIQLISLSHTHSTLALA